MSAADDSDSVFCSSETNGEVDKPISTEPDEDCEENEVLQKLGISRDDINQAINLLKKFHSDQVLSELPHNRVFRSFRTSLHPLVNALTIRLPSSTYQYGRRHVKKAKEMDAKWRNQVALRSERLKQLDLLTSQHNGDQHDILRIPDGTASNDIENSLMHTNRLSSPSLLLEEKQENGKAAAMIRRRSNSTSEHEIGTASQPQQAPRILTIPITCYICKKSFKELHFFYDALCPDCASFNYMKRHQTANLTGTVALVTGARLKIGFRILLILLRSGSRCIATTRFPRDCIKRLMQQPDFHTWKDRVHIFGLDFRDINKLEYFCNRLCAVYDRLDIIINNACQTVRRPPAYYKHLLEHEQYTLNQLDSTHSQLLCAHVAFQQDYANSTGLQLPAITATGSFSAESLTENGSTDASTSSQSNTNSNLPLLTASLSDDGIVKDALPCIKSSSFSSSSSSSSSFSSSCSSLSASRSPEPNESIVASSALASQIEMVEGDEVNDTSIFPVECRDVNSQQVDLRRINSWSLRLAQVSTSEAAECLTINTLAPFVINARLRALMEKTGKQIDKFIVNVSAMEGKFYRNKSDKHPHTNMAKAALNMMTRTSAVDYAESSIWMTAVDTGWINDEKPIHEAVSHAKVHNFQTPLDEQDAAARVLDPVLSVYSARQRGEPIKPLYGIFIKDYFQCEW